MPPSSQDITARRQATLQRLTAVEAPLFAVLDAARTRQIPRLLQSAREEHQSLYEGPEAVKLSKVAPYLVSLPSGSPTLTRIVNQGWGQSWGIYLSSRLPFKELRRHLRRFLLVEAEQTREPLYFRFYDPRVLRVFLPTCTPAQRHELFGQIDCFWMESHDSELLGFTSP